MISLHCPPAESPVINAVTLARMKDETFIVNTTRARLVDPKAVLAALESSKLRGFATDVYPTEPPELIPLLRRDPHAACRWVNNGKH